MAKNKGEKKQQDNRNTELYEALALMEKERGIPVDFMIGQIQKAIITACKNTYGGNEDVLIKMEPDTGIFEVYLNKTAVEEVFDPNREISMEDARKISPAALPEDKIGIRLDPKDFGRIAVQTARNIIRQGIRDGEKGQALAEYQSKLKEIVTATIEQIDPKTGNATLRLGKSIAILPKNEQINGEVLTEGSQIKVYIVDIKMGGKEPRAIISRTHPDLVKRLFESEVPEIFDGTVEIKSISREAGSRTKIAVYSRDENVDAVGACIGPRGQRVGTIVDVLGGEKIDIVEYSEDPVKFISAALSPAEVLKVDIDPSAERVCKATVPDGQLSLAIGNKGQNVRLAAKLTGWKIDIRPESGFFGEDEDDEPASAAVEAADEAADEITEAAGEIAEDAADEIPETAGDAAEDAAVTDGENDETPAENDEEEDVPADDDTEDSADE